MRGRRQTQTAMAAIGTVALTAGLALPSAAAAPALPTLKLKAPRAVQVNHPYRIKASGETAPDSPENLYIFIRAKGNCKKTPTAEVLAGSYSAFGETVTHVGPGNYSKRTPKTEFEEPHKHAKICGYLQSTHVDREVIRNIKSVSG